MPSYQILNSEPFVADQENGSSLDGKKLTVNLIPDSGESTVETIFLAEGEDEAKACSKLSHTWNDKSNEISVKNPEPVIEALSKEQL